MHRTLLIKIVSARVLLCFVFLFFFKKRQINIFSKGHILLSQQDILCTVKKGGSLRSYMLHVLISHITHSTSKTERGSDCLTMCGHVDTAEPVEYKNKFLKKCITADKGCDTDLCQNPRLSLLCSSASVVFRL